MKIFLERNESDTTLTLRKSFFRKLILDNETFTELHEKSAKFFEKKTLQKELRTSQIKLNRQKFVLYEEKRNKSVIGVVQSKKIKMTWAFLCFLQQEIKEFSDGEEMFCIIPQKSY